MGKIAQQCGLPEEEAKETIQSTLARTIKLYFQPGLSSAEVIDLISVKPIGKNQPQIVEMYKQSSCFVEYSLNFNERIK